MQMIVASRLTDGRVVFMADETRWVDSIEEGAIAESEDAVAAMLERAQSAVQDSIVVDPYAIDVGTDTGARRPLVLREAIRAFGPTVVAASSSQER